VVLKLDIPKVDQKYLENFEKWCWRRMEKISRADHVTNEAILQRVEVEGSIIQIVKREKAAWICYILRRNCLLKHVVEAKMDGRTEVLG
jgi:hypothetical protein